MKMLGKKQGRQFLSRFDRFYLLTVELNRADAMHPWLYDRCREVETEPDGHLDLWAREHYKSSIITFAGVIQEILIDPEITIGIFSHTKPVARKFMLQIKEEFESNKSLQELFPDIFYKDPSNEAVKWAEEKGIQVRRKSNAKEATVEAHGLVDGMPTGAHFRLRVYDDVVTQESVNTPEQVKKTTNAWALSDNLGATPPGGGISRAWHIGTRYCTRGDMRILMADWSHKPIADVRIGDQVIGWELENGKRWLRSVRVLARGTHLGQPVNEYTFSNGRSVVCTEDHKWWRGARGSGDEYKSLAMPGVGRRSKGKRARIGMGFIRQLLVPVDVDQSREAGWLAGFFDGEGTTKKNKHHPSGMPCIIQTMANPGLIDEARRILSVLGFEWAEAWHKPSEDREGKPHWKDRRTFQITGGWRERYRFLAKIAPAKRAALAATLLGQLQTEKLRLTSMRSAGNADVHWIETESGNYVSEGFCSKNSFGDTYQDIIDRDILKLRVYPATHDGSPMGKPVFLSQAAWDHKKKTQASAIIACQMLLNPAAGTEAMFQESWLKFTDIRPATLNIYIMCDPASSKKKGSDNTAIAVVGIDSTSNKYMLDGYHHKMKLSERWLAIKQLRRYWMNQPGIQSVKVGYERYGSTSDLEYFEDQMERVDRDSFEIVELAWPREGGGSKIDRIQRLEPDFRSGRFYLVAQTENETSNQKRVREAGEKFRIISPVRRRDHEGNVYSLNKRLLEEFLVYPFSAHDDFLDATSRIYDMDAVPPILINESELEPEIFEDGV